MSTPINNKNKNNGKKQAPSPAPPALPLSPSSGILTPVISASNANGTTNGKSSKKNTMTSSPSPIESNNDTPKKSASNLDTPIKSNNNNNNNNNNTPAAAAAVSATPTSAQNGKASPSVDALFQACQSGDFESVLEASQSGGFQFLSGSRQRDHWTSFHQACQWKQPKVVQTILQEAMRYDLDQQQQQQEKQLQDQNQEQQQGAAKSVTKSATTAVSEILGQLTKNGGQTGLHIAITVGSLDVVKMLVEEFGDNIEKTDGHKSTPLLIASREGHRDLVEYIIQRLAKKYPPTSSSSSSPSKKQQSRKQSNNNNGNNDNNSVLNQEFIAAINAENSDGATAFSTCASNGCVDIATALLENGADPSRGPVHPLIMACQSGRTELVKTVIRHLRSSENKIKNNNKSQEGTTKGAQATATTKPVAPSPAFDINGVKQRTGASCLIVAAQEGRNEIVRFLIEEAGADVLATTNDGYSCLHFATWANKPETVKIVLDSFGPEDSDKKRHKLLELRNKAAEDGGVTATEIAVQKKMGAVYEAITGKQLVLVSNNGNGDDDDDNNQQKCQEVKQQEIPPVVAAVSKEKPNGNKKNNNEKKSKKPVEEKNVATVIAEEQEKSQNVNNNNNNNREELAQLQAKLDAANQENKSLGEKHHQQITKLETELSSLRSSVAKLEASAKANEKNRKEVDEKREKDFTVLLEKQKEDLTRQNEQEKSKASGIVKKEKEDSEKQIKSLQQQVERACISLDENKKCSNKQKEDFEEEKKKMLQEFESRINQEEEKRKTIEQQHLQQQKEVDEEKEERIVTSAEFEKVVAELQQQISREKNTHSLLEEEISILKNKIAESNNNNIKRNSNTNSVPRMQRVNSGNNLATTTNNNNVASNANEISSVRRGSLLSPSRNQTENQNDRNVVASPPSSATSAQNILLENPNKNEQEALERIKELEETTHRLRTQIKDVTEKFDKEKTLRRKIETENDKAVQEATKQVEETHVIEMEKLKAQIKHLRMEQEQKKEEFASTEKNSYSNNTSTMIPSSEELVKVARNTNVSSNATSSPSLTTVIALNAIALSLGIGIGKFILGNLKK